MTEIFFKSIRE